LIIRGGHVLVMPACFATPAEISTGVLDVEGLCKHVANEYLERRRAYLTDDQHAELLGYLMLAAWTEAGRFNGTGRLLGFLESRLKWRCTDWYRTYFGRGKTPRPQVVSLDSLRDQELEPDCA
jgi:hypothetical protein